MGAVDSITRMEPDKVAGLIEDIAARLEHPEWYVREAAVTVLTRLPADLLSACVSTIMTRVSHRDGDVRKATLEVLVKVDPAAMTMHIPAVVKVRVGPHRADC